MPQQRPNVLLITADQWRGECLSAIGHPVVRTPNLDKLAAEGVLFRAHYTQASPCGPSRASLLTGMYAMNHRSVRNGTPLDARFTNLALEMRKLGYDPALIGYTDTSLDPRGRDRNDPDLARYWGIMPGFNHHVPGSCQAEAWLADLEEKGYDHGGTRYKAMRQKAGVPGTEGKGGTFAPAIYAAEHSETAFNMNHAIRFVKHQRQPWFLHLSLFEPHPPFVAPEPYNAMYDAATVPPFHAHATPEEEAKVHPFVAYTRRHFGNSSAHREAAQREGEVDRRQLRATYFGMMRSVDDNLGRLFEALRRTGAWENTLIVFTSDHGEMLWDHWLLGKESFHDQATHIPLIIRMPGAAWDGARGRIVDAFTGSIDVMPTVLELLGAEPPLQCDGQPLIPFLRGAMPAKWRQEIFWELDFRDAADDKAERELGIALDECCLAVVRDKAGKYVHFAGGLPPLYFDLEKDAAELHDRAGDPAYGARVLAMAQKMLTWRISKTERTLTGIKLTRAGPVECPRERRFPPAE